MGIPVNARAVVFAALSHLSAGCAVSLQGLVSEDGPGVSLNTMEGQRYRLVALGDAAPVARLDGHLVQIDGRKVFGTVRVEDWKVPEGVHGMQAWVGPLQGLGAQVGLQDRNSGSFYTVDMDSVPVLEEHLGEVVLLEGYVVGPQRIEVLYYRALGPAVSAGSDGTR